MKQYFYRLLAKYINLYVRPEDTVAEINPKNDFLLSKIRSQRAERISLLTDPSLVKSIDADYIVLNGNVHYERDVQHFLETLQTQSFSTTRVILVYYSSLWRPFTKLATRLGWRDGLPESNWLAPSDVENFALLSGWEVIQEHKRILLPVYIPIVSYLANRWLAPLPFFRHLTLANVALLRPQKPSFNAPPSVSVVVAARNEEGNIEQIVRRLPKMGPKDELIFVEGNSNDNTWVEIQRIQALFAGSHTIRIAQQDGKGKGDAVRKGFAMANCEILMILDADMTVPPEDLPKFYDAIAQNKGEFINGSRLVYPMEDGAMRFFNLIGNKFFALAFTYVLSQALKDTLCGTKVLTRDNYNKIAKNRAYFGDFDPFGDFDLLFGAARMGLKIVELPVTYRARTYGDTNIERWKHGVILLRMLLFAARKIKFI